VDNGATTYTYDADGQRVAKTTGSSIIDFIYDREGKVILYNGNSGGANSPFIEMNVGGMHLGTYTINSTVTDTIFQYDHADWLGTERARINLSGAVCQTISSFPFGDGLDYFGARHYASTMGRWMVPDAINLTDERLLNPTNTLNKYAYGGNNPLKYIDPDGRDITVFFTDTGHAGHFWMVAYDQSTGQFATMDFGPRDHDNGWTQAKEVAGSDVPGNVTYQNNMTPDEMRQDYSSLTIQTNPEDAQKAIQAINEFNGKAENYNLYSQNCTTVCRDVLKKILKLDSTSIEPSSLWSDIFKKWSKQALTAPPGSKPPTLRSKHGIDYGQPRYGMNTFDFILLLLRPQKACVTTPGLNGGPPETVCQY
jgi:RHS repeat-associated protein